MSRYNPVLCLSHHNSGQMKANEPWEESIIIIIIILQDLLSYMEHLNHTMKLWSISHYIALNVWGFYL